MDRYHVGTPDAEIAADIRARCARNGPDRPTGRPDWTPALIRAAIQYAIARHNANRRTFAWIDAGLPGRTRRRPTP